MEERMFKSIQNKRFLIFFSMVLALLFILVWCSFVLNDTSIREIKINPNSIVGKEDIDNYLYKIEELAWKRDDTSFSRDLIKLKGWLVKTGESTENASIKIVFQDTLTGKYYLIPTSMQDRDDVTEEINDSHLYRYSGFSVTASYIEALDESTQDYALYALYQLNNKTVLLPLNTTLKSWEQL